MSYLDSETVSASSRMDDSLRSDSRVGMLSNMFSSEVSGQTSFKEFTLMSFRKALATPSHMVIGCCLSPNLREPMLYRLAYVKANLVSPESALQPLVEYCARIRVGIAIGRWLWCSERPIEDAAYCVSSGKNVNGLFRSSHESVKSGPTVRRTAS
jgi:hypothetical protein